MDWKRPRSPGLDRRRMESAPSTTKTKATKSSSIDWATWLRWATFVIGLVLFFYVVITVLTSNETWADLWFEILVAILLIGVGIVFAFFPRVLELGPTIHRESLQRIDGRIGQQKRNLETSYMKRKRTLMQIQADRMNQAIRDRTTGA